MNQSSWNITWKKSISAPGLQRLFYLLQNKNQKGSSGTAIEKLGKGIDGHDIEKHVTITPRDKTNGQKEKLRRCNSRKFKADHHQAAYYLSYYESAASYTHLQ